MQEEQFVLEESQMPAFSNRGGAVAGILVSALLNYFSIDDYCEEKNERVTYTSEYNSAKYKWDSAYDEQERLAETAKDRFHSFLQGQEIGLSDIQKKRLDFILKNLDNASETDVEFAVGGDDDIIIAKTTENGTKYLFISYENSKPAFSFASVDGQVNTRGFDNNNDGVFKAVKHFLLA
jgi:hypothetical protein